MMWQKLILTHDASWSYLLTFMVHRSETEVFEDPCITVCSQGLRVLVEIGTAAPPGDFETWTKSLQDVMLRDPQLQCPHG